MGSTNVWVVCLVWDLTATCANCRHIRLSAPPDFDRTSLTCSCLEAVVYYVECILRHLVIFDLYFFDAVRLGKSDITSAGWTGSRADSLHCWEGISVTTSETCTCLADKSYCTFFGTNGDWLSCRLFLSMLPKPNDPYDIHIVQRDSRS